MSDNERRCYDRYAELERLHAEIEQLRAELAQAREELAWAKEEANVWFDKLMQARAELKDLQGANRSYGRQLASVKENRDYWYDKALEAEADRDKARKEAQDAKNERDEARDELGFARQAAQEQSDEIQHHWLSPCQKAGLEGRVRDLQRQLAGMEAGRDYWRREYERNEKRQIPVAQEAAIVEAAEAVIETARKYTLYEDMLTTLNCLSDALEHKGDAASKLLGRLATLDAAEKALAGCGIGGIYDEFDGLADAIEQMTEYIGDPERCMRQEAGRRNAQLKKRLAEAELHAHVLRESNFVLAQKVRTERALRQSAEQRADDLHTVLYEIGAFDDPVPNAQTRATRAEALAGLVATEETAALLERLGRPWYEVPTTRVKDDFTTARKLAAQIREALDDKQA